MKYIALLRGINVVGHNIIKMADLVSLFEKLGFNSVQTYLQSGNVLFESATEDSSELAEKIETRISRIFGYDVNVLIRTSREIENIISRNPLLKESGIDTQKLHVTFLKEIPDKKLVSSPEIKKEPNELFQIIGKEVYIYCPNGYGRTKLNNSAFEKKLKTVATTRELEYDN